MKLGYWVVAYRAISDDAAVKAYVALAVPAIAASGGRILTRSSSRIEAYEAGSEQPAVLVEFDSYDIAVAAYKSDRYKEALRALGEGAERDFRIVEGA